MSPQGLARLSPATWAIHASRNTWRLAWHLALVNRYLLDVAVGRIRRLMVFMPPRHGKSMLISQYFPGWYLGMFPDRRVILASYESGFASTWGRKARDALTEHGPDVFGIRVRPESSAADAWDVQQRMANGRWRNLPGGMSTAGVGGSITGRGANVFLIDDPIKSYKEANSRTYREGMKDWYRTTALTRLEPNGAMVLMQTRWHRDDLAGHLMKTVDDGEPWTILSLPAIANREEDWGIAQRKVGQPLWPERYDLPVLNAIRADLGGYWWAALYDQEPREAEGGLFKKTWFRYFDVEQHGEDTHYVLHPVDAGQPRRRYLARQCWIFQTCDPAASEDEQADYFVLATWAVTPDQDLLLLDVVREHASTVKHEGMLRAAWQRWQPKFQGVERATFGLNIIQAAAKTGLPIIPLPAEGDKVARARTVAARYELGAVFHRLRAPWLAEWENELLDFPTGEHDDQVDNAAYAGIQLVHAAQYGVTFGVS